MRYLLTIAGALMVLVISGLIDSGGALGVFDGRTASNQCQHGWTVVPSPNPDTRRLLGVAAVSSTDVWAVGGSGGDPEQTALIEHWDGTAWSVVPGANLETTNNRLWDVAAVSSSDVWAVGGSGSSSTLIVHWDGTTWSVVPSPNPGTTSNELSGVAAVSSSDVWAVGQSNGVGGSSTLIEHWNGTAWSVIPSPNPGTPGNVLRGVAAVSSSDVWAVGISGTSSLIEHWDGTTWSVVPSPNPDGPPGYNYLSGVVAVSGSDVWATGYAAMHWDGTVWTAVESPHVLGYLNDVAAFSANDVWAVGFVGGVGGLVEHWDGTSWAVVPGFAQDDSYFSGAAIVPNAPSRDVWVVGFSQDNDGIVRTLIERFCGPVVIEAPTATPVQSEAPSDLPRTGGPIGATHPGWLTILGAILSFTGVAFILAGWTQRRPGN